MEVISRVIVEHGLDTLIIALMINVLTALIKMPIKSLSSKAKDSCKITRFIVFVPIILGFILVFCYFKFILCDFAFNKEFITLWLSSSSLSLSFYAVYEKIFLKKEKKTSVSEESQAIIKELKLALLGEEKTAEKSQDKIVLNGSSTTKKE